jgi:hypothetical protein
MITFGFPPHEQVLSPEEAAELVLSYLRRREHVKLPVDASCDEAIPDGCEHG